LQQSEESAAPSAAALRALHPEESLLVSPAPELLVPELLA